MSSTAVHNAQVLRIDLSAIDRIVLSHGHADHTGGLRDVLTRAGEVEVIGHPDIWPPKYSRREEQKERYIGIPFSRKALEGLGASFRLGREPVRITDRVMTTGEIPMTSGYERVDENLFVKENGTLHPDSLDDDLALVVDADFGLVVILGCGHRGLINALYHAQQVTSVKQIHTVLGGCHLIGASVERIKLTINALKELDVKRVGVSHCTGLPAAAMMAQELGDRFFYNNSGTRINLP